MLSDQLEEHGSGWLLKILSDEIRKRHPELESELEKALRDLNEGSEEEKLSALKWILGFSELVLDRI
jgi:hypothetical protein